MVEEQIDQAAEGDGRQRLSTLKARQFRTLDGKTLAAAMFLSVEDSTLIKPATHESRLIPILPLEARVYWRALV